MKWFLTMITFFSGFSGVSAILKDGSDYQEKVKVNNKEEFINNGWITNTHNVNDLILFDLNSEGLNFKELSESFVNINFEIKKHTDYIEVGAISGGGNYNIIKHEAKNIVAKTVTVKISDLEKKPDEYINKNNRGNWLEMENGDKSEGYPSFNGYDYSSGIFPFFDKKSNQVKLRVSNSLNWFRGGRNKKVATGYTKYSTNNSKPDKNKASELAASASMYHNALLFQLSENGVSLTSKKININEVNALKNQFNKDDFIESNTSIYLNSNNTISILDKKINQTSNKEKIKNLILNRNLNNNYKYRGLMKMTFNLSEPDIKIDDMAVSGGFVNYSYPIKRNLKFLQHVTNKYTFKVTIKFEDEKVKSINEQLAKTFTFTSTTSTNISSESTIGLESTTEISNVQHIRTEFLKRMDSLFKFKDFDWNDYLYFSFVYNDEKSFVNVTFSEKKPLGGIKWNSVMTDLMEGQVTKNYIWPIEMKIEDGFWGIDAKKRLEVSTATVVDKNNNIGYGAKDKPEYDPNTNTLKYHGTLDLTFSTNEKLKEVMKIDGVDVSVKDGKFKARLVDNRTVENESGAKYKVSFEKQLNAGEGTTEFWSFNVEIVSVSDSINFQWRGWDPQSDPLGDPEKYEQWLFTQKYIEDPNNSNELIDNPVYKEELNPETGLIANMVFVKGNNKYPFATDPLNAQGSLIDWKDEEQLNQYNNGYFAEAFVSHKGTKHIFSSISNISRIERVQLDSDWNEIEKTRNKNVDVNEPHLSYSGMYHYIIYQKDYVDGVPVDPSMNPIPERKAGEGSAIHKLIYITGNEEDKYKNFLDLDVVRKNTNIIPMWDSIQANHLKSFLIDNNINSSQLGKMNYEKIVSLWNMYVSDASNGKWLPSSNGLFDITERNPNILKVNTTNREKLLGLIKDHVTNWMLKLEHYQNPVYGADWVVKYKNRDIEQGSINELMINDGNVKTLTVEATGTSTILTGNTSFKFVNDKRIRNLIDLNKVTFDLMDYNFSDVAPMNILNNYIYKNVSNVISKNKPSEWEDNVELDVDYLIKEKNYGAIDDKFIDYINNNLINGKKEIEIVIEAKDESYKVTGRNSYLIKNNVNGEIPPIIKNDISSIFIKNDIGWVLDKNKNGLIDLDEIWERLIEANREIGNDILKNYPNIKMDSFIIYTEKLKTNEFTSQIISKPNDENFTGRVSINFKSEAKVNPNDKIDIKDVFTNLELGFVNDVDGNNKIDGVDIWERLIEINDLTYFKDLKYSMFNWTQYSNIDGNLYSVNLGVNTNSKYKGEVKLTFSPVGGTVEISKEKSDSKVGRVMLWLIPVLLLCAGIITLVIWFFVRRHGTKHKKRKTKEIKISEGDIKEVKND